MITEDKDISVEELEKLGFKPVNLGAMTRYLKLFDSNKNKVAEDIITALNIQGRFPIAWVMVFAEPVPSDPVNNPEETDSCLFPFSSCTLFPDTRVELENILTKAMNYWVRKYFEQKKVSKKEVKEGKEYGWIDNIMKN
jgi:hypothetical protein